MFAVDTNTRGTLSVTAVLYLREFHLPPRETGGSCSVQGRWLGALEMRDSTQPPERLGWRYALQLVAASKLTGRIALIVDSDLGSHERLMSGEEELLPGYTLPQNVTLAYASSDGGTTEFLANGAIAACDKHASALMEKIQNAVHDPSRYQRKKHFCDAVRLHLPG